MKATDLEISALWAQWVGAGAAALAVAVAVVFGYLTLANTRRSKDTQERSTIAASAEPLSADFSGAVVEVTRVHWRVEQSGGESWLLINEGSNTAHDVELSGLTAMDQQRLTVDYPTPQTLGPTGVVGFVLVSRFTLSGPANVVVSFALESGGPKVKRVVRVPAP